MLSDLSLRWQAPAAIALSLFAVLTCGTSATSIAAIYVAAVTPELVRIDLREHRLPNRMVVPGLVVGLAAAALQWSALPLIAGLGFGGFLWLLSLAGGIGMGDVKVAALIGLASPTLAVAVLAPLIAFLLGGIAATVVLVRRGRSTRLAFGPWLLAGYWVAVALSACGASAFGSSAIA